MSLEKTFASARSLIHKNMGLAVAVALGLAVNNFVRSIVEYLILPLVDPVLNLTTRQYDWRQAHVDVGPFNVPLGPLVSESLSFLIFVVGLYVFIEVFADRRIVA